MLKEVEEEQEFPDEIISFLKIKFQKAHSDQEKSILKQFELLQEEKKELKELMQKKRDEGAVKSAPVSVLSAEEAKEKAIKLVQDGTLNLTSRVKSVERDDSPPPEDLCSKEWKQKAKIKPPDDSNKGKVSKEHKNVPKKIAFVSGGVAFSDSTPSSQPVPPSPIDTIDLTSKRPYSTQSSTDSNVAKKIRRISLDSSDSDVDEVTSSRQKSVENRGSHTSSLRFVGHKMTEEFVRQQVEEIGNIVSLELETSPKHNSVSVIVKMESPEVAANVKAKLDNKYIEGRVVRIYFKYDFPDRRYRRRRRNQDFSFRKWEFSSSQRNSAFDDNEHHGDFPPSFFSGTGDFEDKRRISEESSFDKNSNARNDSERCLMSYSDIDDNDCE